MFMPYGRLLCLVANSALIACHTQETDYLPVVPDIPAPVSTYTFSAEINAADFAQIVKVLASDEFEGRAPGTHGETLTVEYIRDHMQRMGLQPGNGDSWFQAVPMIVTRTQANSLLNIKHDKTDRELILGTDAVIGTRSGQQHIHIENSDIVFVGYGVDAPEHDWNDYVHGPSWEGKTVIMLVNDPGFHNHDESLFEGRRMTWYGRWVYKFEEAARKGAAAAFIIHDEAGAGYDWDVVKNSWSGAQYDLPAHLDNDPRLQAQGWLSHEAAGELFTASGLNLDELYQQSSQASFMPISLNATLSLDLHSHITEDQSRNVIGVLPGNGRADEAVLYMAHWDHLGKHDDEEGDNIYNGAIDNASGVAGMLEIAAAMAAQTPPPQRSVVFMATTLEEAGLLGSQYYTKQPTFPLNKIAGVINIDAMSVYGRTRDITVTGLGSSDLEDILEKFAAKQERYVQEEEAVQSGFYFRADHFSFAKAGVPTIYPSGGIDLVHGGMAAGRRAAEDYARNRYHSPFDEYDANWNLDGVLQDLHLLHDVGWELANSDYWPNWYEGNPFKLRRDQMMPRH